MSFLPVFPFTPPFPSSFSLLFIFNPCIFLPCKVWLSVKSTLFCQALTCFRKLIWILWCGKVVCHWFSSVQSLSRVRLFATPWTTARQAFLSITSCRSPSKPMSIESVMPSNHLILCHPLLLLPSMFPSIRVFSNESALCTRWPKYWSFSFNISPPKEYSGLISFRMDWLDILAVQGTLKSLLQHHSSKASFFGTQLSL